MTSAKHSTGSISPVDGLAPESHCQQRNGKDSQSLNTRL